MGRMKDKIAVITGSGKGLGEAMALLFSREGAKIVVFDIDEPAGRETVEQIQEQGGEAIFVHGDVSNPDDAIRLIDAAVDAYGRADVLVNNAGVHVDKDRRRHDRGGVGPYSGSESQGDFSVFEGCHTADAPARRREHYLHLINLGFNRPAKPSRL